MNSLTFPEKQTLESVLGMSGGYVLDFSNREFESFFSDFQLQIFELKYTSHGSSASKANSLRAFWDLEDDEIVGRVLSALLDLVELNEQKSDCLKLSKARDIATRLFPSFVTQPTNSSDVDGFLGKTFPPVCLDQLHKDPILLEICNRRLDEIQKCFQIGAYLSCVIMIGGLMEGILTGVAHENLKEYHQY